MADDVRPGGAVVRVNESQGRFAPLNLAPAYALSGDLAHARWYGRFLDWWEAADSDLALLRDAKRKTGPPGS